MNNTFGAEAPPMLKAMANTLVISGVTINFTALEDGFGTGNDEATIAYTGLTVV